MTLRKKKVVSPVTKGLKKAYKIHYTKTMQTMHTHTQKNHEHTSNYLVRTVHPHTKEKIPEKPQTTMPPSLYLPEPIFHLIFLYSQVKLHASQTVFISSPS